MLNPSVSRRTFLASMAAATIARVTISLSRHE